MTAEKYFINLDNLCSSASKEEGDPT